MEDTINEITEEVANNDFDGSVLSFYEMRVINCFRTCTDTIPPSGPIVQFRMGEPALEGKSVVKIDANVWALYDNGCEVISGDVYRVLSYVAQDYEFPDREAFSKANGSENSEQVISYKKALGRWMSGKK